MAKRRIVKLELELDWDEYEDVSPEMLITDLLDYINLPLDDVKVRSATEVTHEYPPKP